MSNLNLDEVMNPHVFILGQWFFVLVWFMLLWRCYNGEKKNLILFIPNKIGVCAVAAVM